MSCALSPAGSIGDSDPLRSQCAGVRTAPKPKSCLESGSCWGGGGRLGQGCLGPPHHPEFSALGRWRDRRASLPGFTSTKSPNVLASQTPGNLTLGRSIGRRLEGQVRVQQALRDESGTFETESRANSRARSLGWVYRRQEPMGQRLERDFGWR